MKRPPILVAGMVSTLLLWACRPDAPADTAALREEVIVAERAFAATMANRDLQSFASFLAEDAVFFSATDVQRGRDAVVAAWKPFFAAPQASFSWEPEQVEITGGTATGEGTLALSSGPVFDAQGELIGSFNTIWRRQQAGVWKVIFDKGCHVCRCNDTGTSSANEQSTSS